MKEPIKEYGSFEAEPISVDEQVSDGDMIGNLKVIHAPGHTPGHISHYYEKDKLLLGADSIYKHVFGAEAMYISAPQVSIDPVTAIVSAQRLSKVDFDKLLMAHQDSPLLEGARGAVEKKSCREYTKTKEIWNKHRELATHEKNTS
jgi:glyoxylase-like metal-dependent hydrolase (beta-lactamase superfamily II)